VHGMSEEVYRLLLDCSLPVLMSTCGDMIGLCVHA